MKVFMHYFPITQNRLALRQVHFGMKLGNLPARSLLNVNSTISYVRLIAIDLRSNLWIASTKRTVPVL